MRSEKLQYIPFQERLAYSATGGRCIDVGADLAHGV